MIFVLFPQLDWGILFHYKWIKSEFLQLGSKKSTR